MGILTDIKKKYVEIQELKKQVLNEVRKKCLNVTCDKINILNENPKIFTIKFSDMREVWSPYYYDFQYQFEIIFEILEHTEPDNILNKWEQIRNLPIKDKNKPLYGLKYNPEVIATMDKILYEI